MDQHRCPSKAANKAAHLRFLQQFGELNQNFETHGPTTSMVLDLRRLVGDWLTTHICSVDTKLRQCPSAQSVRGTTTPVRQRENLAA
jgi:hemerythrin